jgi:hypothetical protein
VVLFPDSILGSFGNSHISSSKTSVKEQLETDHGLNNLYFVFHDDGK